MSRSSVAEIKLTHTTFTQSHNFQVSTVGSDVTQSMFVQISQSQSESRHKEDSSISSSDKLEPLQNHIHLVNLERAVPVLNVKSTLGSQAIDHVSIELEESQRQRPRGQRALAPSRDLRANVYTQHPTVVPSLRSTSSQYPVMSFSIPAVFPAKGSARFVDTDVRASIERERHLRTIPGLREAKAVAARDREQLRQLSAAAVDASNNSLSVSIFHRCFHMLFLPFAYKVGTFTEQLLAARRGLLRNNSLLQGGDFYRTTPCCMVGTFTEQPLAAWWGLSTRSGRAPD
jgi:hypothetical protein